MNVGTVEGLGQCTWSQVQDPRDVFDLLQQVLIVYLTAWQDELPTGSGCAKVNQSRSRARSINQTSEPEAPLPQTTSELSWASMTQALILRRSQNPESSKHPYGVGLGDFRVSGFTGIGTPSPRERPGLLEATLRETSWLELTVRSSLR